MELTFKLTPQEADLVLGALAELPYKLTADLITKLRVQAAPQLAAKENTDENPKTELHPEGN